MDVSGKWPGVIEEQRLLNRFSCLNGWAFGNLAISAHDIAMFEYDVFATEDILNATTK